MGCADASGACDVSMGSLCWACCPACPLPLPGSWAAPCPGGQKAPMLLCGGVASGISTLPPCKRASFWQVLSVISSPPKN